MQCDVSTSLHLLHSLQCEKQEGMIDKLLSRDEEGLEVSQFALIAVPFWYNACGCIYCERTY